MQFMMMVKADKNSEAGIRSSEEMANAGVLVWSGGLAPELIGGFAI
jgi:hypothetical protein